MLMDERDIRSIFQAISDDYLREARNELKAIVDLISVLGYPKLLGKTKQNIDVLDKMIADLINTDIDNME